MEKEEALNLINTLRDDTKEYKKLLISSKHPTMSKIVNNHDLIEDFRQKLITAYEQINYVIYDIGDKPQITYGITPEDFCAYEAAYDDDQGKLFKTLPALELCIEDLLKIRKKVIHIDEASFHDVYGEKFKPEKVQKQSSWLEMILEPFSWMFNIVLRNKVTCLTMSFLILVFIKLVLN
ncbi:MAG: hypothetical protein HRT47_09470 [Candidatus Caenarcaniphilales bacterium]|nr:hypothetical protein [Candidatus Caenarcaniphilales bacterium]